MDGPYRGDHSYSQQGFNISRSFLGDDVKDENCCIIDAKRIIKHVYPDIYGVHKTATFGNFRERLADFATFIGFKAIEEDV